MNEIRIPVLLCEHLNRMPERGEISFVPEVWREGEASVWLTGASSPSSEYIDGSGIMAVGFEIRLRCSNESIGRRLDAIAFFSAIEDYVRTYPVTSEGKAIGEIIPSGGSFKSAVYENGDEEYRAAYSFRYLRKA